MSTIPHEAVRHSISAILVMAGLSICLLSNDQPEPAPPRAQNSSPTAGGTAVAQLAFEVASVKPTDTSGQVKVFVQVYPGGRIEIFGYELEGLIHLAFHPFRISGGTDWMQNTKYDMVAVPPQAVQKSIRDLRSVPFLGDARLRQMLQTLLLRRFQLRFHYENSTGNVYLLERGGRTPAFQPSSIDPYSAGTAGSRSVFRRGGQWELRGATMPELAAELSSVLESPVLDQTGLNGAYDYKQRRVDSYPPNYDPTGASFLTFFRELHLNLKKTKGQISTFVIDGAQRPSPN